MTINFKICGCVFINPRGILRCALLEGSGIGSGTRTPTEIRHIFVDTSHRTVVGKVRKGGAINAANLQIPAETLLQSDNPHGGVDKLIIDRVESDS